MKSLKKMWQERQQKKSDIKQTQEAWANLCVAIRAHDLDAVKKLFEQDIDLGTYQDKRADNPMVLCAAEGTVEIMDILLDHGGHPSWSKFKHAADTSYERQTMLSIAIENGHEDIAILLAEDSRTNFLDAGESFDGEKHTSYPKPLEQAREAGMKTLITVLASREAQLLRKEADALETEAIAQNTEYTPKLVERAKPASPPKTGL